MQSTQLLQAGHICKEEDNLSISLYYIYLYYKTGRLVIIFYIHYIYIFSFTNLTVLIYKHYVKLIINSGKGILDNTFMFFIPSVNKIGWYWICNMHLCWKYCYIFYNAVFVYELYQSWNTLHHVDCDYG